MATKSLTTFSSEQLRYLFGPVAHQGSGWHDTIPAWMIRAVIPERIAQLQAEEVGAPVGCASDLEAVMILYESTLCGPPTETYAAIYFKLSKRVMDKLGQLSEDGFPIKEAYEPLSRDEERVAIELKRKIRNSIIRNCNTTQAREKLALIEQKENENAEPCVAKPGEQIALAF